MRHAARSSDYPRFSDLAVACADLVVEVFRCNGDMLAIGNALGADIDLRSAHWQVLGAMSLAPAPLPVAHIARNMGLTRQAVQRSIDDMRTDGLVVLQPNPHHRRAPLIAMTDKGNAIYQQASAAFSQWADTYLGNIAVDRVVQAVELLREMRRCIDDATPTRLFNPVHKES